MASLVVQTTSGRPKAGLRRRDFPSEVTATGTPLNRSRVFPDSVRRETYRYLDGLNAEDLSVCPNPERRAGYTVGKMFSHVIVEESQHTGQVAYIRGLQRGIGK